jgi:hypothetical protein
MTDISVPVSPPFTWSTVHTLIHKHRWRIVGAIGAIGLAVGASVAGDHLPHVPDVEIQSSPPACVQVATPTTADLWCQRYLN